MDERIMIAYALIALLFFGAVWIVVRAWLNSPRRVARARSKAYFDAELSWSERNRSADDAS